MVVWRPMSLGERVRQRLEAMNLTAAEASKRIGRAPTFLRDLLKGRKRSMTETNARRLALVLGTTVEWLIEGRGAEAVDNSTVQLDKVAVTNVPLVGYAEIGVWREGAASMGAQTKPVAEPIKVAPPPGYEGAALFALHLRDGSMNKHYGPDSYLIVCPLDSTDARIGDHVIVTRTKNGMVEVVCA